MNFSQEKYQILLTYFQNNFYAGSSGIETTKKSLQAASAQLENLLRFPGVRNILCNRTNNINFDKALKNGEMPVGAVIVKDGEIISRGLNND